MRVLVTGHRGYIGSVLTGVLRRARYDVVGLDCDWYRGCDFGRVREPVPGFETDLRDIEFTDLLSFDAVIHLAAVPEDHDLLLDPTLTEEINYAATMRLAECCKQAKVSRFVFASTCAVYGANSPELVDETGPTAPITDYARSKLRCERDLARLADGDFTPVLLRMATAYGVSPRMRLDTVVNDFVASAVAQGRVNMQTTGRAWRPLMHVEDIARAYAAMLTAANDLVANQVFNVANTAENYRVADVAELVSEIVPRSTYTINSGTLDRRSYRVNGDKLVRTSPGLAYRWTLRNGIRQLRDAMENAGMTPGEWRCGRYRRLLRLRTLVERGEIDSSLRFRELAAVRLGL
jgi:nucleoside-diphosphate-sugar epimerase